MVTYNLGKGTVLRLLRDHGVQLRNQRMTPAEVAQAIQLYQTGNSLAAVGAKLGYDHGTIWQALKQAGVPRRTVMAGSAKTEDLLTSGASRNASRSASLVGEASASNPKYLVTI
jgi:hypothetical protein